MEGSRRVGYDIPKTFIEGFDSWPIVKCLLQEFSREMYSVIGNKSLLLIVSFVEKPFYRSVISEIQFTSNSEQVYQHWPNIMH